MQLNVTFARKEELAKDILKSSTIYTLLGFLPLSFALVFTPIYLMYLSEAEYGILNLFMLYSGIISLIYSLGVSSAFGYIYWDVYKKKEELKELIASTLGLLVLFQVIFISIGLFFGETIVSNIIKSSAQFSYNPIFITALFFSAFMVFYEMFLYFFRNENKLRHYAILSISTLILLTIGTLTGVVWLDMKEVGAVLGRTFGYGVIILCFLSYFIFKYGIKLNLTKSKALMTFGIPLFINALIGSLSYGIDRIIIERFDTLENLGVYGFALVIISIIEIWYSSLNNALSPTLFKYIKESSIEKRREIKGLSHTILFLVIFLITIVLAFLYPALELLIPENFHRAALFVPILAFGFIWRVFTTLTSYSLFIEKKTNYLIYNQSSNLVLTILIGYAMYQIWDIMGLVVTMYVVRVIEFLIMNYISRRVKVIEFEFKRFIGLSIFLGSLGFIIVYLNSLMNSNLRYLLYSIPFISLLILFPIFLKKEMKNLIFVYKMRKKLF
jgi:O-antigen/teichoic acid export membrane protein